MSKIFISRNRTSLGQFTPEEVAAGLKSGKFFPVDLAWREGMETWQPLSTFTDIAELAVSLPAEFVPVEPPSMMEETDLPPLPSWEQKEQLGFVAALSQSLPEIILRPAQTFSRTNGVGGIWSPLVFLWILGVPATICGIVWLALFTLYGVTPPEWDKVVYGSYTVKKVMLEMTVWLAILSPLLLLISAFISAGFMHLFLMITGGANRPFGVTFRVYCYVNGAFGLFQIILGGANFLGVAGSIITFAYAIWILVVFCIGLKAAHQTQTWRVVVAFLLPIVLCCCGSMLLGFLVPIVSGGMHMPR